MPTITSIVSNGTQVTNPPPAETVLGYLHKDEPFDQKVISS